MVSHISRKTSEMWGTQALIRAERSIKINLRVHLSPQRAATFGCPHISLIFREMWDTTNLTLWLSMSHFYRLQLSPHQAMGWRFRLFPQYLSSPFDSLLEHCCLRLPKCPGAGGLIEAQAYLQMTEESVHLPRRIVGQQILHRLSLADCSNDRGGKIGLARGVASALATEWVEPDCRGAAGEPTVAAKRNGNTRIRGKLRRRTRPGY